ncbi:MAG: chromosome segregation protein SMC [Gemmatimonadetes bacterium]|nr:chromosome segregation protein SMC [Gemmatimonadota bacterium]MCC7133326.1 chromosome segregation protein SMC [Gemmatimonadales bacterium]
MKLLKLELSGFKSFADTVTLEFDHGVTAIVGPNGCGKSNVSDAVRWVLGETSARLLRGGKMEDVIFQGSVNRRPVNVTEVSLYLDNADGDLPIAYREVVITRRLTRSGQSEYFINKSPVRLRDVNDLLRGTGLGSDAGVVMEAKMIDLLLSDRADERRSLFEEAAGIGLYRDRKHSTERRLEETAADLQRLEDLLTEVQSQIRSLARQKGKAERHGKLMEEKFSVQLTLARRLLDELEEKAGGMATRHELLKNALPDLRERLAQATQQQEICSRDRSRAEEHRAIVARDLSQVQLALGKLDGDLAVAAERLAHARARRDRDEEERQQVEVRTQQAALERDQAAADRTLAEEEHAGIQQQLASRAQVEEEVRQRLSTHREEVRRLEEAVHAQAQSLRALEGERTALEGELASLREALAQQQAHCAGLAQDYAEVEGRAQTAEQDAADRGRDTLIATAAADRARHLVAETREREASERDERRLAEESLAQLTARRAALEELERDRVGLAPAAQSLLAARERFGDAVLGPLSDFISTNRDDAELAERLLGEWMHAILVRDWNAVNEIHTWYEETQPGALVLLPVHPGPPDEGNSVHPLTNRLSAEGPAASWIDALLRGSEILHPSGRVLKRRSGAVLLTGAATPSGPIRRRADLVALGQDIDVQEGHLRSIIERLTSTRERLVEVERMAAESQSVVEQARERERQATMARDDAHRLMLTLARERQDADNQLGRLNERIARAANRQSEVVTALREGDFARVRQEESLGAARATLASLEGEQEAAREGRVHWQVQEAHVAARLRATNERLERANQTIALATQAAATLSQEIAQLEQESVALSTQHAEWAEQRRERVATLVELEATAANAEGALAGANAALQTAEQSVHGLRDELDGASEEYHRLEVELTEVAGVRRSIIDRVETEWRAPFDDLIAKVQLLDLDRETLETEIGRIVQALEAIGPVNPLAVEEHAEETKRHEFLTAQRDDLVAARQSLLQAIKEIDGTAKTLFLETFAAVQANFQKVFQTLFGGGECDLRLSNQDDPLEAEIEIHAAPRGKKTQRIHLLSSGERTLVAVSLLFSIYLTKPSPFCLMDEVDAPLDDSNVGRFTNLLHEFKGQTQFVVITHNPRTMQAADAVFGVTMQEPGVSTIVGVRLGDQEKAA